MPGWRCRSITSWVLPNWMIAVVLPGAGRPGQDQPTTGAEGVPVEQGPPAAGVHDLPQRRGRDHPQPGVVVQAGLVVADPVVFDQALPLVVGQQLGWGRGVAGELPPALQRGQVPMPVVFVEGGAPRGGRGRAIRALRAGRGGHHRLLASWNGSKTPSGTTLASGWAASLWGSCPLLPAASPSTSPSALSGSACGRGQVGCWVARVRAATRRWRPRLDGVGGGSAACGPRLARASRAATASATSCSVGVLPWSSSSVRAWFQASSPKGVGTRARCFQKTVIQPPSPSQWSRTQIRLTS